MEGKGKDGEKERREELNSGIETSNRGAQGSKRN